MKKVRQLWDRPKETIRKFFGRDKGPTGPSAPIPPIASSLGTALPVVEQVSLIPPPETLTPLVPSILSGSVRELEPPVVPVVDQVPPHIPPIHADTLPSEQPSEPLYSRDRPPFLVVEQSPTLQAPESTEAVAQTQTPTEPAEPTVDLNATATPVNPTHDKRPVTAELGIFSLVKSKAWANLKGLLDAINQAASISGLGPVKKVIEGIANCIGIYEEAARDRKEYDVLRIQLESTFGELKQYFSASPAITTSIASICGSIQKELAYIKIQQAKNIERRFTDAEIYADDVLGCYRRIQDHLQRLSRNANISTWVIVDQLATDYRLRGLSPSLWACYNSEKATELKRGPCTEGTRINVLEQIREWAISRNTEGVYWINGMAGTGKTTIAYSLCQQLDTEEHRLLCASFFCSRLLPECRSVGRIIPSIAYQIARCSRPFRYALSKATEEDPDAHTRSVNLQFDSLILGPLSDIKVREAFPKHMLVVVDALDECEDAKSTQQILEVLLTNSKDLPIKFIVSSRPEASIRHQMEKNGTWVTSRVVLHELDSGEVQMDIKKYLRAELSLISPTEDTIKKLAERAGVLFIYAATVIRYVGYDNFGRNPRARLNAVLGLINRPDKRNSQTEEIDQLYETILQVAISDKKLDQTERDDMKLVLNTVVCAKAPLTVDALNGLLKLGDAERVNAALRPLWSVLHIKGQNMPVTTLHASFPDYLTDPERSGNSVWYCDAAVHHHILAKRCFECIRDARPQFNICRLESSYLNDNEVKDLDIRVDKYIPSELGYACRHWAPHLHLSDSSAPPDLVDFLEQFLANNLLLWLEIMNLTQDVSVTPEELTTASQWAMRHGATDSLMNLMRDALRFTLAIASSPVRQSTPHIYISMLPFLKSHSPMEKHYGHRMHGMVGVEGTARDQRQRQLKGWSFETGRHGPAACSPDCTMLAIATSDLEGSISLVEISSGCLVRDIYMSRKDIKIFCLRFSPDGTHLASGTSDGAIWVWDVRDGELVLGPLKALPRPDLIHRASIYNHAILSLLYSHSGSYIISGSGDGTIQLWDANSGKPTTAPLLGHTDMVMSMAISPDDTKLVSGSYDNTIRVWNMQSGSLVFNPIKSPTVTSIAIPLNGKFIVSGSRRNCTVCIWDIHTGQAITGPLSFTYEVRAVAISPDNAHISVSLNDGTIQIWDVQTAQAVSGRLQAYGPECNTKVLTYSPDGTRIISYSRSSGCLSLFDPRTVAMIGDVDTLPARPERILSIDISPDGKHIVSGSDRHTLRIWDINGDLIHGPLAGHASDVRFVRYSADGNRILSCSYGRTLRQWDAQNGGLIQVNNPINENRYESFQSPWFQCAAYSPDGGHIATLSYCSDVCIWCSSTGEMILRPIPWSMSTMKPAGSSINFSTNGKTLVTSHEDGTVQIRNAKNRRLISHNKVQSDDRVRVRAFAFSADLVYNVLAQGGDNPTMYRRLTRTGELTPGHFNGHDAEITSVQFSPDGTRIISGSSDKTVHIWDARSGTSIFGPLNGHADRVNSVAYSPDGTYVASASDDATIRIWDASTQPNSSQHVSWVIKKDGWVMDDQSRRLVWVPPELYNSLILPRNKMVISCEGYVRLNFEGAYIGEAWVNCWTDN